MISAALYKYLFSAIQFKRRAPVRRVVYHGRRLNYISTCDFVPLPKGPKVSQLRDHCAPSGNF